MDTISIEDFITLVVSNHNSKKWLSCTFQVAGSHGVMPVSVKAYGKWCQRLQCHGLTTTVEECKTVKAFKEALTAEMLALDKAF